MALAAAAAARNAPLGHAILADASAEVDAAVVDDARAAAALMGMNNVYYRFRHMVGKPVHSEKPARLATGPSRCPGSPSGGGTAASTRGR